jgi:hypothetical protein
MLVGHWYRNREAVSAAAMSSLPFGVEMMIRPYRAVGIA